MYLFTVRRYLPADTFPPFTHSAGTHFSSVGAILWRELSAYASYQLTYTLRRFIQPRLRLASTMLLVKTPVKCPKKGKTGGVKQGSIPPSAKQVAKRRNVLGEDKYGPVEGAKWKRVNARFPNLYKALLEEPDKATRGAWLKRAIIEDG